jgi:hypothetical protein
MESLENLANALMMVVVILICLGLITLFVGAVILIIRREIEDRRATRKITSMLDARDRK